MPDQGQPVPRTWPTDATPRERQSASSYNRLRDINVALEQHFGYLKERVVAGATKKRRSTPADNKRLHDLCLLIDAVYDRSILVLFAHFEAQTHEDRNTFDKLVDILVEKEFGLEYAVRYSPNPADRRTKSLRLTDAGMAAISFMRQTERKLSQRQAERGDFDTEDARPGELEAQDDDYASLTLTDEQLLAIVRGEQVGDGK